MEKTRVLDLSHPALREFFTALGEPAFRAGQLLNRVYRKKVVSFAEMTDLPQPLRERLESEALLFTLKPLETLVSSDGLTQKVLFGLADGNTVESTFMGYAEKPGSRGRGTVCVSSQVGCAVGCPFCATGQQGFKRNLTPGEIIEQALYFTRSGSEPIDIKKPAETRRPVTNVVFMGMGEPLANYDAVREAVVMLNAPCGMGLGSRQITVSTSGLVPEIRKLAGEDVRVELAVSLHAAGNALRDRLVPLNRKYPLEMLIPACEDYFEKTGRRPTFEYALFRGLNDSPVQAIALVRLLRGMNAHVNLIAGNPTENNSCPPSLPARVRAFHEEITRGGLSATIRESRGASISAGCGQLRSRFLREAARR